MKYALIIIALLATVGLRAQNIIPQSGRGFAVIRGSVENNTDTSLEYVLPGFLDDSPDTIIIDRGGQFMKRIGVGQEVQDMEIVIGAGAGLYLYVEPNDTINLHWDAKDPEASLSISSPRPGRATELQTQLLLCKRFIPRLRELDESLYKEQQPDSVKFRKLNGLYNEEITALLARPVTTLTDKIVTDTYFRYAGFLLLHQALEGHDLLLTKPYTGTDVPFLMKQGFPMKRYEVESEEAFRTSSPYRQFLFNYIRFCKVPFKSYEISEQTWPLLLPDYYKALGSFHSLEMRDWFITKFIMDGFEFYPFEEADTVYRDFMTKNPAPFYADTLQRFYADFLKLKPGSPAPGFVLKNEAGQDVSLSDFRGRMVYIDFWGVGCGPCIWDIKNRVPALHSKYKDKALVFINICVDSDEKAWKNSLRELNLDGVNLLAEGWTHNLVCKAYHIVGIPHYCLIGKDGRIINAGAPTPSDAGLFRLIDKHL